MKVMNAKINVRDDDSQDLIKILETKNLESNSVSHLNISVIYIIIQNRSNFEYHPSVLIIRWILH